MAKNQKQVGVSTKSDFAFVSWVDLDLEVDLNLDLEVDLNIDQGVDLNLDLEVDLNQESRFSYLCFTDTYITGAGVCVNREWHCPGLLPLSPWEGAGRGRWEGRWEQVVLKSHFTL